MCTRNQPPPRFIKTNTGRQESSNIIIVDDLSTSMFINSYIMKIPPNHWENFRVKLYYRPNRLNRLPQNVTSQTAEYVFLSAAHAALSNRDQILGCRTSLDKHQKGKKILWLFLIIMEWNHIKQQENIKKHYKHIEVEKMAKESERLMD